MGSPFLALTLSVSVPRTKLLFHQGKAPVPCRSLGWGSLRCDPYPPFAIKGHSGGTWPSGLSDELPVSCSGSVHPSGRYRTLGVTIDWFAVCVRKPRTSVGTTSFRPPVPCISVVKTTVVAAANKPPRNGCVSARLRQVYVPSSNEIFRFPKTGLNVYRSSGLGVHGRHPVRTPA